MDELNQEVARLKARIFVLERLLMSKPSKIKSPNIMADVIKLGYAKTATEASNWLLEHGIGTEKELKDFAELEKKNKENKPLVGDKKDE